jgi:PAS domain S-box-containing protein
LQNGNIFRKTVGKFKSEKNLRILNAIIAAIFVINTISLFLLHNRAGVQYIIEAFALCALLFEVIYFAYTAKRKKSDKKNEAHTNQNYLDELGINSVSAETEEELVTLFNKIQDAACLLKNNIIIKCNNEFSRLLGRSAKEELTSKSFLSLITPLEKDEVEKRLNCFVNDETPSAIYETKFNMNDGTERDIEIYVSNCRLRKDKLITLMLRDITERKRAEAEIIRLNAELEQRVNERTRKFEEAIKIALSMKQDADIQRKNAEYARKKLVESNKRMGMLTSALEHSPVAVVITDNKGNIEYVNSSFIKSTGYESKELIGKNCRILKSGKHSSEFYKALWDKIIAGEQWQGEFCDRKKDGVLYWEHTSIVPIKNEAGKATHFVAVKDDITERKNYIQQLEEAKTAADSANRAKSEFLANMSHEIRTPMNAIIGLADLVLKTNLTLRQSDYLNKIANASASLLHIINDILDFSKIEAGKFILDSSEFDIEQVLNNVSALFLKQAYDKNIEIVYFVDPQIPRHIIGDALRLEQILINICGNAIKFTEKGMVVISIEIESFENNKCILQFGIRDTGVGLSAEEQDKIFRAFQQADASITRKYGGTGLGLAISKNLVNLMGGDIRVESKYGKGSLFAFTIPFEVSNNRQASIPHKIEGFTGRYALICDDNEVFCEACKRTVEALGLNCVVLETEIDALEELEKRKTNPYMLLLVGYKAYGINGLELSRKIYRNNDIAVKPEIIIMINGLISDEIMDEAKNYGVSRVIEKPIGNLFLFNSICEIFGKKGMENNEKVKTSNDWKEEVKNIKGARVLLVEDNSINQTITSELLQNEDIIVEAANNGQEAIDKVLSSGIPSRFDLVLMDIHMPFVDGYTATRKIREYEHYKELPIIALSADAISGVKKKVEDAGMNDMVDKPIKQSSLFKALIKYIKPGARILQGIERFPDKEAKSLKGIYLGKGINTDSGLKRLNGNVELYEKLLRKFHSENYDLIDRMNEEIKNNNIKAFAVAMHTMKSVAGNMGFDELSNKAAVLEEEARNNPNFNPHYFWPALVEKLTDVLTSIEIYEKNNNEESLLKEKKNTLCENDFIAEIKFLIALLKDSSGDALRKFAELKKTTNAEEYKKEFEEISAKIENYEFLETIKLLEILLVKMEIKTKS